MMRGTGPIWSFDDADLDALTAKAAASSRLRAHHLIHESHDDQVQRLLIAAEPRTYVRPHLHSHAWELLVLLRGGGRLLRFREDRALEPPAEMSPDAVNLVEIAPGARHGFAATEPGTVLLEIKPGPYRPNEFLDWAPEEGTIGAQAFVEWSVAAKAGEIWPKQNNDSSPAAAPRSSPCGNGGGGGRRGRCGLNPPPL